MFSQHTLFFLCFKNYCSRIYERDAIQKHFDEAKSPIRSPMTNEPIGRRLLASPQIKELIETLIQSGAIVGDLQKAWEEKVVEKKNAEDLLNRALLKRAEGGDAMAMYKVSIEYREGEDGFEKNGEKSYKWIVKAHAAKLPAATASLSVNLINGRRGDYEITQDKSRGLLLLGIAAAQGSDYAALQMGLAFAHGQYDVPYTATPMRQFTGWHEDSAMILCTEQLQNIFAKSVRKRWMNWRKCNEKSWEPWTQRPNIVGLSNDEMSNLSHNAAEAVPFVFREQYYLSMLL